MTTSQRQTKESKWDTGPGSPGHLRDTTQNDNLSLHADDGAVHTHEVLITKHLAEYPPPGSPVLHRLPLTGAKMIPQLPARKKEKRPLFF